LNTFVRMDESAVAFCIGQHESKRLIPVSSVVVHLAHDANVSVQRAVYTKYSLI
jgi:hypothetical protein